MIYAAIAVLFAAALFGYTAVMSRVIERRHPNIGRRVDIGGMRINALHLPAGEAADLPPVVIIHGASGNLCDQATALRAPLEGRGELLIPDRPGHGYSERGGDRNAYPDGQADAIARLMDRLGIKEAVIVGHSFGGAVAASFGLLFPEKTRGLVFVAPATHPWDGSVDWHQRIAALPVIGPLFCRLLPLPVGLLILGQAIRHVFAPNPVPPDYIDASAVALVLRPENFRNNAIDLARLDRYLAGVAPHYRRIERPAVILTGDADTIVAEELHSVALKRDLPHAELIWVKGLGHKPDYAATDLVIAAIEKIAGIDRDLQTVARDTERRIAQQKTGAAPLGTTPGILGEQVG